MEEIIRDAKVKYTSRAYCLLLANFTWSWMEIYSGLLGAGHFPEVVDKINIHSPCFLTKFHPPHANNDQFLPMKIYKTIHYPRFTTSTAYSALEFTHYRLFLTSQKPLFNIFFHHYIYAHIRPNKKDRELYWFLSP